MLRGHVRLARHALARTATEDSVPAAVPSSSHAVPERFGPQIARLSVTLAAYMVWEPGNVASEARSDGLRRA